MPKLLVPLQRLGTGHSTGLVFPSRDMEPVTPCHVTCLVCLLWLTNRRFEVNTEKFSVAKSAALASCVAFFDCQTTTPKRTHLHKLAPGSGDALLLSGTKVPRNHIWIEREKERVREKERERKRERERERVCVTERPHRGGGGEWRAADLSSSRPAFNQHLLSADTLPSPERLPAHSLLICPRGRRGNTPVEHAPLSPIWSIP